MNNPGRNCPWEDIPTEACYQPKTKINGQQRFSLEDFAHPYAVSFIKQYEKNNLFVRANLLLCLGT